MGLKSHPIFGLNGLMIFLGWIVGRLLLFAGYFYHVYLHWEETKIVPPVGMFVLLVLPLIVSVLNVVWFTKIWKGVMKVSGLLVVGKFMLWCCSGYRECWR